ncbi:MAG: hypothetical protein OEY94_06565 [Alphaproteobacteria bacterium]|nr:hypothetical protein [Alphaproteobacteria bacterium]
MSATFEIAVSLVLFLLLCGGFGASICGCYYKKKQQNLCKGFFLGSFTGVLAGIIVLGAVLFLWLGF